MALVGGTASAQTQTIDFESLTAPCVFVATSPLTTFFQASHGAVFGSANASLGGMVLHQCSGFGLNAHSGVNFLAFNNGLTTLSENIFFSRPQSFFSMWVSNGTFSGSIFLEALNSSGGLLGTSTVTTTGGQWSFMSVSGAGISQVRFTAANAPVMVVDDLTFNAVPEPMTVTLLATGLVALGAASVVRRRRHRPID